MPDLIRCNDPKCTKDDVHELPCTPRDDAARWGLIAGRAAIERDGVEE